MYRQELGVALRAVNLACRVGRSLQDSIVTGKKVVVKADASPVTLADFSVQALVTLYLKTHLTPAAGAGRFNLVAEEDPSCLDGELLSEVASVVNEAVDACAASCGSAAPCLPPVELADVLAALQCGKHAGGAAEPFWVLDPIDGTKGFIRGGQYAVGLAYVVGGVPVLGVIGCPNLEYTSGVIGCLFSAVNGQGAFVRRITEGVDLDDAPVSVHASTCSDPTQAQVSGSFESSHSPFPFTDAIAAALGTTRPAVRLDSMVKYCMVARGQVDVQARFVGPEFAECIWDHAPGAVLVTEAGGVVTDVHGRALDFTAGGRLTSNVGVLACAAGLHSLALRAASAVLASRL